MELGLTDKVAIVTGGSRGLGGSIVQTLAAEGVHVLAVARTQMDFAAPSGRNGTVTPFQIDLRHDNAADAVLAEAMRRFGKVDILSNNAGTTKPGDFFAISEDAWLDGFALKFHATRRLSRACWPMLKASGGTIVNTIGIMSRTAVIDYAMGGAVNTALLHLTKALADLGTRDGVRVNAVNPGRIRTDRLEVALQLLMDEQGMDRAEATRRLLATSGIGRFGEVQEVADAVCFLASARASFINGAILEVDGGQTKSL